MAKGADLSSKFNRLSIVWTRRRDEGFCLEFINLYRMCRPRDFEACAIDLAYCVYLRDLKVTKDDRKSFEFALRFHLDYLNSRRGPLEVECKPLSHQPRRNKGYFNQGAEMRMDRGRYAH